MATLIMGAAGAALAGPWGALAGSLAGQAVDRSLFGQIRQGPRLGDLRVQTSQYGNPLPRAYGTMRMAGTLIWATDLQESGELVSGGKGSGDTLTYSYTASFAVALSSRPVRRIGRIWADGILLRGEAGDFKVPTGFRFYPGLEDQTVDPIIASVEGIARTPAFRGLAVVVFEQLQLARFGNRIPVLTFEVEADSGGCAVDQVLGDLSRSAIDARFSQLITGYAAYGSSIEEACAPLIRATGLKLKDTCGVVESLRSGRNVRIPLHHLGCSAADPVAAVERGKLPASTVPVSTSISYYDPALDYQQGEQHSRVGRDGPIDRIDFPGALTAEQAKSLASGSLSRAWREREHCRLRLPLAYAGLEPGDRLVISEIEQWQVRRVSIDSFVVVVDCIRPSTEPEVAQSADAGRSIDQTDVAARPTRLELFEAPSWGGDTGPVILVAASAGAQPWQRVPLAVESAGFQMTVMSASRAAIVGTVGSPLPPGVSTLVDMLHEIIVVLDDPDAWLSNADEVALDRGKNLALLGSELLQFGRADSLGNGQFRLTKLWRGRAGTESAAHTHKAGERFCLLEEARLTRLVLPTSTLGATVRVSTRGLNDAEGRAEAEMSVSGASIAALSPAHLRAHLTPGGRLSLSWVRRCHAQMSWVDGDGSPPDRPARFRVTVAHSSGKSSVESSLEQIEMLLGDAYPEVGSPITCSVSDISGPVPSAPATITILSPGDKE